MFNIFGKFFDYNQKEINRLQKRVEEVNKLEEKARALSDKDFPKQTEELKSRLQSGEKTLDDITPWAFAMVREMARRVLGERHYDVQIMAGLALAEGKVAEQKTGEGKTLSATAPLYLNALSGKGAHLVTVNDYLARRDTGWMGQVYHNLGLRVAAMISEKSFLFDPEYEDKSVTDWRLIHLKEITRRQAYEADITYGINSEFGFDYLRDNMAQSRSQLVQKDFNYAIIDEVDSVLIDEARTPHIISAPYSQDTSKYYDYAAIVKRLDSDNDYIIDEKAHTAHLTEQGIIKIEKMLKVDNIYEKDYDTLFHVEAALKARTLFRKDKEYIIKDNEVIIVDEFTGRLLHGRRFSEGIHQAIEAKENVPIKRESRTLATVSLQNYFRMYDKLAGMTGTAATEAEEFKKIYDLEVLVLPTHRQLVRKDQADLIYKTERGKFTALVEEIGEQYKAGRPVLVGTTSIDKNEILSSLLKKKGIPHELLNAKNHLREAAIIANAGKEKAVTVATNMAGRGVDIVLGGEPPNKYEDKDKKEYDKKITKWRKDHDKVIELGGLYVIGTERHESRRIDNQLRGRAGRQGDPGESRFFVSLEDDLMRIFGGEQVGKLMTIFKIPENQPLEHAMVSRALEQAQSKVEGFNFDIRKHLVEFDDVLNKQREIIYERRKKNLVNEDDKDGNKLTDRVENLFSQEVANLLNMYMPAEGKPDHERLVEEYIQILPVDKSKLLSNIKNLKGPQVEEYLLKNIKNANEAKQKQFGKDLWQQVVASIILSTIDKYWTEHLTSIDDLREGINLRGYAQLDPLNEYKNEAYSMFEKLLSDIDYEVVRRLFRVELKAAEEVVAQPQEEEKDLKLESASRVDAFKQAQQIKSQQIEDAEIVQDSATPAVASQSKSVQEPDQPTSIGGFKIRAPGTADKKPGRNDPCWCGSGKKYKKCHYPD